MQIKITIAKNARNESYAMDLINLLESGIGFEIMESEMCFTTLVTDYAEFKKSLDAEMKPIYEDCIDSYLDSYFAKLITIIE